MEAHVLRYFGGKFKLSPNLVALFPEHHCYVEPFCGSASVLMHKNPSRVEVINDLDNNLVNFLLVMRSEPQKLMEALRTLPSSRYLFELWQSQPLPDDPFERAVVWFYLMRQKIIPSGVQHSGWRASKVKSVATDYQNAIERIPAFVERLRYVMIENRDYKEVLRFYDSEKTLFYVDPPYIGKEDYYFGKFNEHERLAQLLNGLKGKVVLSYYPHPMVDELYKGWWKVQFQSKVGTVNRGEEQSNKRTATELVLINFEPPLFLF